ncbi:MAG: DEAD/DEAH box helicase [Desulfurococcales archaeon]|nr:DEAD/DEAH box helicase [Desulfurococcales archaeon]
MRSPEMVTEATRRLMKRLGFEKLYPPQEEAIRAGVERGRSILLASPTASGKTFIAMAALANNTSGGRSFYIVPLRSIAQEKYREFRVLEDLGFRVGISIGDYRRGPPRADIVVTTYEKLDSLARNDPSIIGEIRVLVVDEIHYIGEPKRGPILETLLARITHRGEPQIVALSATVPNAREIGEWIGATVIESSWRPVPLREGVYRGGEIVYADTGRRSIETHSKVPPIDLAIDSSSSGGQTLVFTQSRRRAEQLAVKAARYSGKLAYDDKAAGEAARKLRSSDGPATMREVLSKLIASGVAYHHAGLSNEQRGIVEDAFRAGGVSVIFATPTLAAGVNLPARRVVVEDYYRFEEGYRRPIPVAEYKQLAGRAGRPGLDPYGEAIIVARGGDTVEELLDGYIRASPEPVESRLGGLRGLRHSILGAVSSGYTSLEEVVSLHMRTLYSSRVGRVRMGSLLARAVEDLVSWGLLRLEGDVLGQTLLGAEVSKNYLDPETVPIARSLLPRIRGSGDLGLLYLIASLPDMPRLVVPKREEDYILDRLLDEGALVDRLGWIGPSEFRRLKTALLLYDWINEVSDDELSSRYNVGPGDVASLADTASWLAQGLAAVAPLLGHEWASSMYRVLEKRIRYGVRDELLQLVAIPGIGRVRARRLYSHGFKTLQDLMTADPKRLERIPGIGPGVIARILEFSGRPEEAGRYKRLDKIGRRGLEALLD